MTQGPPTRHTFEPVDAERRRGRGATGNPSGRFEARARVAGDQNHQYADLGWTEEPDEFTPPALATTVSEDTTKSVITTDWRSYMLQQPKESLPVAPMALVIHLASAWVPFTSEAKEAIAHYPEILKEIRLSLMEMGRKIATHIRKTRRADDEAKKRNYIDTFLPTVVEALHEILTLDEATQQKASRNLREILEATRKQNV